MEKRDWIIELMEELKNEAEVSPDEPERWTKTSIYKIPVHAVNMNKEAYLPWAAAIGPYHYHHKDEQLQQMEGHKKRALAHILCRSEKPLKSYVDPLVEVVHDLMDAYGHLDEDWKQDAKRFLHLMIIDGCFILEIMRAYDQTKSDYDRNDLIFSHHGKHNVIPCIRRDMLLLENQVPLLVLERLHAVESGSTERSEKDVIDLILKFYGQTRSASLGRCQHILDVFRKSMIRDVPKGRPTIMKRLYVDKESLHSATEMKEAGIKFQKSSHESLKDISFEKCTLRLLDDTSESTFLNMVAFERLHVGTSNEISFYIYLMNRFVSDAIDVRLLESHGIIYNVMGSRAVKINELLVSSPRLVKARTRLAR
ncbi:hypothetical protein ACS0TY_009919 [Phlomoides rotata]